MRRYVYLLLIGLVLAGAGCNPPPPKVDDTPRELTPQDMSYLHARGIRPEQYNSSKARAYLRQRDDAKAKLLEAQKNRYLQEQERQKRLAEKAKKSQ